MSFIQLDKVQKLYKRIALELNIDELTELQINLVQLHQLKAKEILDSLRINQKGEIK